MRTWWRVYKQWWQLAVDRMYQYECESKRCTGKAFNGNEQRGLISVLYHVENESRRIRQFVETVMMGQADIIEKNKQVRFA